jgi:hypothetical protein
MKATKPIQCYQLKDKDELVITGRQLRQFKYFIIDETLKGIKKLK